MSSALLTVEGEELLYDSTLKEAKKSSKEPLMDTIRGILLIPSQDYVHLQSPDSFTGLQSHDVNIPDGIENLSCAIEPYFLNQPLSKQLLYTLKEQIVLYYKDHNRPVVAVYVPEQEIVSGVLKLVVMEGALGHVSCSGNRWFGGFLYEGYIRLDQGEPITTTTLLTDVAWINRNPFRSVDVVFIPGCDLGTTNIELLVNERFPLEAYVGCDNTGMGPTGNIRLYGGGTWGNALFLDHVATYQYTTTTDTKQYQSQMLHYTAPLPWRSLLHVYGGFDREKPSIQDFSSRGNVRQASARYVTPFGKNYKGKLQEITVGFDYKNFFDIELTYIAEGNIPIIEKTFMNLTQFVLGYALGNQTDLYMFSFNLDLYWSPGKILTHQDDILYNELSYNAKVKYIYGLTTSQFTWFLPYRYSLWLQGRLQLASQVLLPSEKFGIGGYDTVRGYLESQFNADNALILNAELRSRPFSLAHFFKYSKIKDEMYFLFFCDYGLGNINDTSSTLLYASTAPTVPTTQFFLSIGPGFRYTVDQYLSVRFDWGIKMHKALYGTSAESRFHGGIILSF